MSGVKVEPGRVGQDGKDFRGIAKLSGPISAGGGIMCGLSRVKPGGWAIATFRERGSTANRVGRRAFSKQKGVRQDAERLNETLYF
jgi:hypothetical protein